MKKLLRISFVCVLVMSSSMALADGKFYADRVPPELPYQRAIISHQDGEELLILQSKFEGAGKDFGWVVPVPALPKLGSMDSDNAHDLFWHLGWETRADIIDGRNFILTGALLVLLGMFLLILVERISCAIRKRPVPKFFQGNFSGVLTVLFLIVVVMAISIPNLVSSVEGIEILSAQQVGVYDVKVIKATDASELVKWLKEHNYKFTPADEAVFNSYIQKGWCFVTARITAKEQDKKEFRSWDGLVNPLVLVFQSKEMIYPLALTATIGKPTEVLLYILAPYKVTAGERLETEYAGDIRYTKPLDEAKIISTDKLSINTSGISYITKLKGRLTSEQMKEDLIIKQAPDDNPYRETI